VFSSFLYSADAENNSTGLSRDHAPMMLSPLTGYCWTIREIETENDNRQLAAVSVLVRDSKRRLSVNRWQIYERRTVRLSVIGDARFAYAMSYIGRTSIVAQRCCNRRSSLFRSRTV